MYTVITERGIITPKASDYAVSVSPGDDFRAKATYPRNYPGDAVDIFDDEASYDDIETGTTMTGLNEIIVRQQQAAGGDSLFGQNRLPQGFQLIRDFK